MTTKLAPIVIFTYKRLDTLKSSINSLRKCKLSLDSELFIFSDGPKNESDIFLINDVRDYVKSITGFKSVELFFSEKNKGLATSIIGGVSAIFEKHDTVIVLEDDLVFSPGFLVFMNEALNKYANTQNAFSVSGYSFNLKNKGQTKEDAYFLSRGWSWGWATWKDRWLSVDWDVKSYEDFKANKILQKSFNRGGSDLSSMLQKQMNKKIDSWAIRWFYHQFRVQGLTLYPVYSQVLNIGFDDMATHTTGSASRYLPKMDKDLKEEFILPGKVEVNKQFQKYFQRKMGIGSRLKSKIATFLIYILRYLKLKK
ncbi:glycosyl transferase family 2 [Mucilaginibacter frigoritolerans]|uniref:Glycosyl transferase family 2 n=1 Tax=Mucilaginibacter frigoritolerans TaxID=652788 RepID=A0A562UFP8_9SPHI|nr:glycosyltransferase [Mucilaginibacter frigoritolerans]TWJ04624.1 glycosyl transferase family 2 [Mucilaginibacter frigoritolerans]